MGGDEEFSGSLFTGRARARFHIKTTFDRYESRPIQYVGLVAYPLGAENLTIEYPDRSAAFKPSSGAPAANFSHHRWYVAAVLPGKEDSAERHLRRQGFVTFLPRQKRTVRHARRLSVRHVAFFPGYVFIRLDLSRHRWRSINGTVGVRNLVCQGDRPSPCPPGLVEQLSERCDGAGLFDFGSRLEPGSEVRIAVGPLADLIGVLERMDGAGRARILLNIMNSEIGVTINVEDLAA